MRLLSTQDEHPKLGSFTSEAFRPPFAILSHTWMADEDEVTFANLHDFSQARRKLGWQKISQARQIARNSGYEWIWVDTCCIDKSSSAELTESINSMFRWYRDAAVCFVYLADSLVQNNEEMVNPPSTDELYAKYCNCRWFSRGWTLQEMIAPDPRRLCFYNREWKKIGTLSHLGGMVARITGLPSNYFKISCTYDYDAGFQSGVRPLRSYSVAQRLSWAAGRLTAKVEDRAYSLLGMMDVNMSLIYGEGSKAFTRLQEAIIKANPYDTSVLAWLSAGPTRSPFSRTRPRTTLLASSLDDFAQCNDVIAVSHVAPRPLELTSTGVLIDLLLFESDYWHADGPLGILPCRRSAEYIGLKLQGTGDEDEYTVQGICSVNSRSMGSIKQEQKRVKLRYLPPKIATWPQTWVTVRQDEWCAQALKIVPPLPCSRSSDFELSLSDPIIVPFSMKLTMDHEWHGSKSFDLWITVNPLYRRGRDKSANSFASHEYTGSLKFVSKFVSFRAWKSQDTSKHDALAGITLPVSVYPGYRKLQAHIDFAKVLHDHVVVVNLSLVEDVSLILVTSPLTSEELLSFTQPLRTQHMYLSHKAKDHVCKVCSNQYANFRDLKRHVQTHRSQLSRYRCIIKHCKFYTRGFLRHDHVFRHMVKVRGMQVSSKDISTLGDDVDMTDGEDNGQVLP